MIALSIAAALQAVVIGLLAYTAGKLWAGGQRQRDYMWRRMWKAEKDLEALDETVAQWLELSGVGERKGK